MTSNKTTPLRWPMIIALLGPFICFIAIVIVMSMRMTNHDADGGEPADHALVNTPAPETKLKLIDGHSAAYFNNQDHFNNQDQRAKVRLVNFWGSWCPPCRDEQPILMQIAQDKRIELVGIAVKDNAANAQHFLNQFGNPFKQTGLDPAGKAAINWGVYGPPETFLLNQKNIIIYKHSGPLTTDIYQHKILPRIEAMLTKAPFSNSGSNSDTQLRKQ